MVKGTRKWMILKSTGVGLLLIGAVLGMSAWLGVSLVKAASVAQALVTVVAIGVGGVWAFYKLGIFRELQPHLTISQEVTHRNLGSNHIHVSVTATLFNNSKVAVEIRHAEFRIQQISPFEDAEINALHKEFLAKPNSEKYLPFPSILEYRREWDVSELIIEPGETETEVYEFIVRNEFETVSVDSFFVDTTNLADAKNPKGWVATSVHDIR